MSQESPITEESARRERLAAFQSVISTKPADPSAALERLGKYRNFCEKQFGFLWGFVRDLQAQLAPPSSAQRPDTSDSARGHALEWLLDLTTYPHNSSAYDAITVAEALRVCNEHRHQVMGPLGCWESNLAGRPNSGYQRVNLRNTVINGRKAEVRIYLHQLTLIADNRRGELMAAVLESELAMECSHLCHNGRCFRPSHLVVEPRAENKERQTCNGHFIIKHGGMTYNPCRHGFGSLRRDCLLPVKVVPDGYHYNR
uniref:Putative homing endonuclease n=1 Tax=Pleopsidium chlorophanum TaxID=247144 RepID=A3QSZ1_9LECA|nr:putative homing endonuclease [Pleopsidium chlorophanum]